MGSVKILKASAGSGKTYRLAYEYVRSVIDDPSLYKQILAVTFTNKATEEMKHRIISEINLLATGAKTLYLKDLEAELSLSPQIIQKRATIARTKILHDYSHFAILTIDKFFQRIIRSFIKELGIDLNFNLELQTDTLLSSASDALIDDISTNDTLKRWITEFVEEKIAESKKWDVKSELTRLGKEVFKESYKRVEAESATKEDLWKIVSQANTKAQLAVHSIRDTARQAIDILTAQGLVLEDFAYGKSGFVNYIFKCAAGELSAPTARVNDAIADDSKWYTKTSPRKADITQVIGHVRPLLEQICALYAANIRYINSASLLRENFRNFALLTDLSQKITDICTKGNIMPISETNNILHELISGNDTPFIFEKAGNHFSQFMIDEFQDTSTMQWENFIPLLQNATSQSQGTPVLLVGDIKQSIYRWRGGDWQILAQKIDKEFDDVLSDNLSVNYRSMSNVVEFNNKIISGCISSDNMQLNNELDAAHSKEYITAEYTAHLRDMLKNAYDNHAQSSSKSEESGYINITRYAKTDNDQEAIPPIIVRIEQLQERGYAPSDIAILVRYNYDGVKIANMLLDYKSRNPSSKYSYDVVTQEALTIGSASVVRFIVACLELSTNSNDTIKRALFNRWLGFAFDKELQQQEIEFLQKIRLQSPVEAFESIVIHYSLNQQMDDIAYLQALHQQIITFSSSTISDISLFLKWWNESGSQQSVNMPQSRNSITIISVHKAKGLQYPAVIIPYCNWGLSPNDKTILWADCTNSPFEQLSRVPIRFKKSIAESFFATEYFNELVLSHIDNINIFYVATTRAEQELHIMIPEQRRSSVRISDLIMDNISIKESIAHLGTMQGRFSIDVEQGLEIIEFGQEVVNIAKPIVDNAITAGFCSRESGTRVKLRLPSWRYTEDGTPPTLTPRSYGVLMHKVFENVTSRDDIQQSIESMQQSGALSSTESENLRSTIAQALENPTISSWFAPSWTTVRNENDIIIPRSSSQLRPDRVMINGTQAVVVDYKFGIERNPKYSRQIAEYMSLLKQMGYTDVSGYIWYVSLNDVEPVGPIQI